MNNSLMEQISMQEPTIRLVVFVFFFITLALLEHQIPKRRLQFEKTTRWVTNLSIATINLLALRWLFPLAAVGIAATAESRTIGILHIIHPAPLLAIGIGFLLMDLGIYWQHRLSHRIPVLWRIHKIHHTDLDLDLTSGLRFHPIEILLSMLVKSLLILSFGIPVTAVLFFEITLSTSALISHSNIRITSTFEKYLRWLLVTPDMHRIHHSILPQETNRNFCFNISLWDRIFKSYCATPINPQEKMQLGLHEYRTLEALKLPNLIRMPFQSARE